MTREQAAESLLDELERGNPYLMKWSIGVMLSRLPGVGSVGLAQTLNKLSIGHYQTYEGLDVYARYRLLTWLLQRSDPKETVCEVGKRV